MNTSIPNLISLSAFYDEGGQDDIGEDEESDDDNWDGVYNVYIILNIYINFYYKLSVHRSE